MPMIRTVFLGDDDVIVQLKRWWLPSWLSMAWYNYTKLSAARNAIEKEIDDCITKLEGLLNKRQEMEEDLAAEVKEVRLSIHSGFGEGKPYQISDKRLKEWAKPHVPRPDVESWRTFFHPLIIKEYGLAVSLRRNTNNHSNNPPRPVKGEAPFLRDTVGTNNGQHHGLTTFTLDNSAEALQRSVDNPVVAFKEQQSKGNKENQHNVNKERMKELRRDNPKESWENDKEWHDRISDLAKSTNQ